MQINPDYHVDDHPDPHIDFSDLSKRLNLLASIQPGYTLNTHKRTLVYHSGWSSATIRAWYAENRQKTIFFVEDTLEQAIRSLTSEVALLPLLKQAKIGISNLKITYEGDTEITQRIENCLTRLENACTRFERLLITSIEKIPLVLEMMRTTVRTDDAMEVRQTPTGVTPNGHTPMITSSIHTPLESPGPSSPGKITPVSSKHDLTHHGVEPHTPPSTPSRRHSPNMSPPRSPQRDKSHPNLNEGGERDPIVSMLDDMILAFRISPFAFRMNSETLSANVRFGPSGWKGKLPPTLVNPSIFQRKHHMEDID